MNVFVKELKFGVKVFLLWAMVLAVFIVAGTVKYSGVESGGAAMTELIGSFPRIVLAVMGFAHVDLTSFGGFYGALQIYAMVVVAVYAIHLGRNAVSREQIDKTYEFLFVKPRSRAAILGQKLAACIVFLVGISALNFVFSAAAYPTLGLSEDMTVSFVFFSGALLVIGLVFLSLSMLFAALTKHPETGAFIGNLSIVVCYLIGVAYDMVANGMVLRVFTPFRYFDPNMLLDHQIDPL
ncbi:MAG: ABC transporter permease subunit, partial [Raoultibacter sp.]